MFPVSIPLTVKINIDESDMRDFESHSSSTVESLHMLVQLNSLDNTIRDYDTVAEKRIEVGGLERREERREERSEAV